MNKRFVTLCLLLSGALFTGYLLAEKNVESTIRQALTKIVPPSKIGPIAPSPMDGISEVLIGMSVYYVSNDGKYVLQGKLIDVATRADLTEKRLSKVRLQSLAELDENSMIIFPADKPAHTITVFTDIDCGYCRKLHNEIADFNAEGITVRYLSFPRGGPKSASFDKSVSVWCADDRNKAMTEAKRGGVLEKKDCANPVREHFNLGVAMGVRGTPAILVEDGALLPGYVPAKRLLKQLNGRSAGKT